MGCPTVARLAQDRRTRTRGLAAFCLCVFAYFYPFPYHPQVNNPNENVRFYMTAAIVEEGTYFIDQVRARWGWVNDAGLYEGHLCSVKSPGTSLLGVPGYFAYHRYTEWAGVPLDRTYALWFARLTASVLPSLAFLWAFERFLRRRGGEPAIASAVFFSVALGSLMYAYGLMFVSHALSAASAFISFMLLRAARRTRHLGWGAAFVAGFTAAGVTAFEYPGFFATALLCLYALTAFRPWTRIFAFGFGAILPTAAVLHFHDRCFGSPFTPGHRYLEYAPFRDLANEGFFGASSFSWDAAGGLLFHPAYGLLTVTPVLFFAFLGFPVLLRRRRDRVDTLVALAIPLSTYALICFMNNWRGGWTVGARYLAVAIPFVAHAALEGGTWLARRSRMPRLFASISVGATIAAFLLQGSLSAYYPHVPEAFTRPLLQLMRPLVRHDFAPYNLGSFVGERFGASFYGTASMLPLFAAGLVAWLWIAWSERKLQDRFVVFLGSVFAASFFVAPFVAPDPDATGVDDALSYVVRFWDPRGHDRIAHIEAQMGRGDASAVDIDSLPSLYAEEGRANEQEGATRRVMRYREAHHLAAPEAPSDTKAR